MAFLVKNHRVIAVEQFRKFSFSSDVLATLPLPPSLQTWFATSTMLLAHLWHNAFGTAKQEVLNKAEYVNNLHLFLSQLPRWKG